RNTPWWIRDREADPILRIAKDGMSTVRDGKAIKCCDSINGCDRGSCPCHKARLGDARSAQQPGQCHHPQDRHPEPSSCVHGITSSLTLVGFTAAPVPG